MTIDRLDCEVNRVEEVLAEAGVKTIDQLVDKYEREVERLRTYLYLIVTAPSASSAHKTARKALGMI